jgi:hypothetical protein
VRDPSVFLYWLPLGAGGRCVHVSGRLFEAVAARRQHRPPCDLYHTALEVRSGTDRFVIEMTPAWTREQPERGVVLEGPVGARWLGTSVLFRYEVRRWRNGVIPDQAEAVGPPRHVATDRDRSDLLLRLVPQVPAFTWGRDDTGVGDMWNSNSLTSWLLASSGHDPTSIGPPLGGRAPGWQAGLAFADHRTTPVPTARSAPDAGNRDPS